MKTRADFKRDFGAFRANKKLSLEKLGDQLDVSATTIQNWEKPDRVAFPDPERWALIRSVTGLDPAEYDNPPCTTTVSQSIQGISASGLATVSASNVVNNGVQVSLTPFEHEVLLLFRRYGNQAMAERCLKQLRAVEAMTL